MHIEAYIGVHRSATLSVLIAVLSSRHRASYRKVNNNNGQVSHNCIFDVHPSVHTGVYTLAYTTHRGVHSSIHYTPECTPYRTLGSYTVMYTGVYTVNYTGVYTVEYTGSVHRSVYRGVYRIAYRRCTPVCISGVYRCVYLAYTTHRGVHPSIHYTPESYTSVYTLAYTVMYTGVYTINYTGVYTVEYTGSVHRSVYRIAYWRCTPVCISGVYRCVYLGLNNCLCVINHF
ncbi:hypothetical protein YC2023_042990 [Brassica napus]